jgi:hypothetical protein
VLAGLFEEKVDLPVNPLPAESKVARWHIFKPKIPIWGKFR